MAKFRATINQPGVRAGKVIDLDPNDPGVKGRVAAGRLVLVDAGGSSAPVAASPAPAPIVEEPTEESPDGDADASDEIASEAEVEVEDEKPDADDRRGRNRR